MPAGLTALALFAQAATTMPASAPASYGPATPPPAKKPAAAAAAPTCTPGQRGANPNEIVICAPKSDGYRLDPDVVQARRELRNPGRPPRPGPSGAVPRDCSVGPMGCGPSAGINLVAAAITAATMAKKAASGENVGRMFVTDPHPSEYQLYLRAKARREAEEAAKADKARAAAAAAAPPKPVEYQAEPAER